uniref:Uncharacterized protein n=1 Tax=Phaeomonas parva TaxID=124430 RepID=A0A7S1XY53_9STRA|eukprot:CAMPEP_0118863092 /NCGR_PEP_ID=MMETSP1163-20130328/8085_1 /TAXON_ID=124430 /ORGANISM="Phaeomonas parva, Strain CCMP2877" /LENGTH=317 /DNA_ID=CAMNT_0006797063 /DNA_START=48 /DNA_END=1001 /DNA_ORIENTATION=+
MAETLSSSFLEAAEAEPAPAPLADVGNKKRRRRPRRRNKGKKAGDGPEAEVPGEENAFKAAAREVDSPVAAKNILPTRLRTRVPVAPDAAPEPEDENYNEAADDDFCFAPHTITEGIADEVEPWNRSQSISISPEDDEAEEAQEQAPEEVDEDTLETVQQLLDMSISSVNASMASHPEDEHSLDDMLNISTTAEPEQPEDEEALLPTVQEEEAEAEAEPVMQANPVAAPPIEKPAFMSPVPAQQKGATSNVPAFVSTEVNEDFDFDARASETMLADVKSKLANVPPEALEDSDMVSSPERRRDEIVSRRCLWFLPFF